MDNTLAASMAGYDLPKCGTGDLALQKYLFLQSQHEQLTQHMYDLCPTYSCTSSTAPTSPSTSPTRASTLELLSTTHTSPSPSRRHRRSSGSQGQGQRVGVRPTPSCLEPVLDEHVAEEMALDEQKLCDVNEGIKRALTELLNSSSVRQDHMMRTWVQMRLMDTERELRTGRRRRSNGSID